jgi:phospholipid/cholesterol/gamma-HCH transport system ATP-binding protein
MPSTSGSSVPGERTGAARPDPAGQPVFRVRGLEKSYGAKRVLDGIDFDVWPGECLVILGRSGTGKSVTLRQLNGLEKPDAGTVEFAGQDIVPLSERQLFPLRKRIAMLFQSGALFDSMNVFENIAFPLREHTDKSDEDIAARVRETLELVELPDIEERMPSALSGGMRKRVALARSVALEPEVLLFDEPTTGLDPMTSDAIAHLIATTRQRVKTTSVVVTHDLPLAHTVATRLAFLEEGRFRFVGTWEEAAASDDALVAHFLAGKREGA